jgi:metallo-beta-lactamase family protein
VEITFHGAAQTVTGSQHLLSVNGKQILLDCGLYQGARAEAIIRNRTFLFDPTKVDALILSHAHIDHCGNIPNLVKQGFRGPIHTTHATVDLCDYMLRDSGRIQESDAEYANKRALKRGEPANVQPLYTEADAKAALPYFIDQPYDRPFEVAPGVHATFTEAGHILGSVSITLDIEEPGGRKFRLAFSGDIGRLNLPILRDPQFLHNVDYVIMESTYGQKNHRPPEQAHQELVYALSQFIRAGDIPPIPVYVDSPLADKAATVMWAHVGLFDAQAQEFIRDNPDDEVFGFKTLKYTKSVDESKAINDEKGPLVIISASGMCESGRILHHLRNNIEDPRNTILIVSWQAFNTLGRRIADREPKVRIFGDTFKLKAQVATINGYSGHAGRDLLLQWAGALKPRLKRIFLVHGEPESAAALADGLKEQGQDYVHIPHLHETVTVV